MSVEYLLGDLFNAPEQYIAHQCNCVTIKAAHLSKSMFKTFPWADTYSTRNNLPNTLGTIDIRGNGVEERFVINMYAQYYPGHPKFPQGSRDGVTTRERAFKSCLSAIAKIPDLKSIAFPKKVGCGAAGGNWHHYQKLIEEFANLEKWKVVIYQLPDESNRNLAQIF